MNRMPSETVHTYVYCLCDGDANEKRESVLLPRFHLSRLFILPRPSLLYSGCVMAGNGHVAGVLLRGIPVSEPGTRCGIGPDRGISG